MVLVVCDIILQYHHMVCLQGHPVKYQQLSDQYLRSQHVYCLRLLGYDTIRYDTRCYFNVRSKADISQLNLPHGTDN